MHFPTWIDLKGQDSVPETVHHVVSCYSYRASGPGYLTGHNYWYQSNLTIMFTKGIILFP